MGIENRASRTSATRDAFLEGLRPVIKNPLVLEAFRQVDRREFAPYRFKSLAYKDKIIPLNNHSSISQPMTTAVMIDHLFLTGKERVLEIGTASGYGAAVLSHCASEVYTVEYDNKLATKAARKLKELGYTGVQVHIGDGALGLAEKAPFDAIIVTAAARDIPKALEEQLAEGGRIVIPVGKDIWNLKLIVGIKYHGILFTKALVEGVHFFPLMSQEHGGWTAEALQHVQDVKRKLLQHHIEKELGRNIGSEEELREVIAEQLKEEKIKKSPEDIDLDEVARFLPLPDWAFDDPNASSVSPD